MQLSVLLTLNFLLLMSCCIHHAPVQAQVFPPLPSSCTAATPPPPELRPLDSDANLLSGCSLPEERAQKSAISETTAHKLALCNSFCTNRVFSGDYALTDAQKQSFPGYPVWLIATQSYLLSDDGTSTDCILGDNQNGCSGYPGCQRFTPIAGLFEPVPGGYKQALDCKLGCMLQFETPSLSVTNCRDSCKMNCESVACQCQPSPFGGGCEPSVVGPCGRFCIADSCEEGCSDADVKINSNNITTYPSTANPTQAPVVTQIGSGTRYMISITNSIPSGLSSDLGLSTLIVRVLDTSSTTASDYTYFVLENGFEFDLAPFACRSVEISFAVATHEMNVSSYSPSTVVELSSGSGPPVPQQLTSFNYTVEQDNRSGFYQNFFIHLEWEPPQNIEFADGYTISLIPGNDPSRCKDATFTLTNNSITSYTIRSNGTSDPPLSACFYTIRIEVNPRSGSPAEVMTSSLSYILPSDDNVQSNCSSVVDRSTVRYDVDMFVTFDQLFTLAVISAINSIRVSRFEIDARGGAVPGREDTDLYPLDAIESGPFTFLVPYDDLPQVENGHGYRLSVSVRWRDTGLTAVQALCDIFTVVPIPPDPVENVVITFNEAFPQNDRYFLTVRYNWTAPTFQGEGITGYEVWLQRELASPNTERNLQQLGAESRAAETRAGFVSSTANFTLYFQLRAVGMSENVRSQWSTPIAINVSTLLPPAPVKIEDNEFNVTRFLYSVSDTTEESDNLTLSVEVDVNVAIPGISNGSVGHIQVYVGNEAAPDDAINLLTEAVTGSQGMTVVIRPTFSNIKISGFGTQLFVQVRGRALFDMIESTGEWSNPEILTVRRVSPPTNIDAFNISDVRRTMVDSGRRLRISVSLSLSWVPPVGFDSLNGYQVILSRNAIGRFVSPSNFPESATALVSERVFNSTTVTFTNLELNTDTLDEIQLSLHMRTLASDIIEGGGEWSTAPVGVVIPAQPAVVNDEDFKITDFSYRPRMMSTSQLTVTVEVQLSFAIPGASKVDVYIGTSMITGQQDPSSSNNLDISSGSSHFVTHALQDIQEINNQEIFVQVRVSTTNIDGVWSSPEIRRLTPVLPPTGITFIAGNSRFRRSLDGSTLVVDAVNIDLSWMAPPSSSALTVTGYDALYTDMVVSGYVDIGELPGQRRIQQELQLSSVNESVFRSARVTFPNSSFDDDVTLYIQMRTRADILSRGYGGNWSDPVPVVVPIQPQNMTDENFNVTSYMYSLEAARDGGSPMLNVSLNMSLLTPAVAGGEIKQLHVNLGTEKLSAVAEGNIVPIDVVVEGKVQSYSLEAGVPLQPEASLPGTDLYVQVRAVSNAGSYGDWAEAESFALPEVPSPENITVKINSAKQENNLQLRLEVILEWKPPSDLKGSSGNRRRRQTDTRDMNDITDYEVLISTQSSTGIDFAEAPSGLGVFTRRFGDPSVTRAIFPVEFTVASSDDIVNNTLYFRMRTVTTQTSAGGEWSDPMPLALEFPEVVGSLTAVIAGTTTPLAIIIVVIIIIIIVTIVYLAYRTKRIKDEYQVTTGEVNWNYDWNADIPHIAPGMVEGKEPLLDEWEIPTTDVIVEDHLGEGAFGYVFKGVIRGPLRNQKLSTKLKQTIGLPVAIKLLKDTATRKERADFLTEIEMMKKISEGYNNHIVNLVGCVTIQEPLCLITEYVPHGDLLDYLRNQRKKNAARRRQERLLRMHNIKIEANREYYEEMIRQAKISQSAQSEDSDLGRTTTGSGYSELVALREMDSGQGTSSSEPVNGGPDVVVKETQIDASMEGVAVVGGGGMPENTSEVQLLREESSESNKGDGASSSRLIENGVLNPITEEEAEDIYPEKAAPYLEAKNEYSHLDPKTAESATPAAATTAQGEALYAEDEELLRAMMQTDQIGELEANDLMQFAYQIATGMDYLASLNIVHRDLACRNILVGEGKSLKITDFGLSREVEEVYVKKTKGRLPLKWMAIESIDAREFTTASDVWSYGVVLWEIGTLGGFPYPTIPNQDLLTMLKQGHRLEKPDNCAPEVYEIMLECWQEHANDRPTFSQLRNKFSTLLLANADDPYMVLEVDDEKAYYNVTEEESSEQRESTGSNDSDDSLKKKGPPKKPVWAKPSNPYVETPAISKDVAINVEEETPQETDGGVATTPQQNGGGLGVPTTTGDGFDPYIRMRSSPAGTAEQSTAVDQLPPMSMSLPAEHSMGLSLSVLGEEKPVHQPVRSTRSNPYVEAPGSEQLLEVEDSNGIESKLPVITENGGTENLLESEP